MVIPGRARSGEPRADMPGDPGRRGVDNGMPRRAAAAQDGHGGSRHRVNAAAGVVADSRDRLRRRIKDLASAEVMLADTLARMARCASSTTLRMVLEVHRAETDRQVQRLHRIGQILDTTLDGAVCAPMAAVVEADARVLGNGEARSVPDATIIPMARRTEELQIALYEAALREARNAGEPEVFRLLIENYREERAADQRLEDLSRCRSRGAHG